MSGRYDDIIHLPHHISPTRKRMPQADRAAQFSPFAALTGHEAAIVEAGRLTDTQAELDVDGREMMDRKLRLLAAQLEGQPIVAVTYFRPDDRKLGGAYLDLVGRVRKIDLYRQALVMDDGTVIDFGALYDISWENP